MFHFSSSYNNPVEAKQQFYSVCTKLKKMFITTSKRFNLVTIYSNSERLSSLTSKCLCFIFQSPIKGITLQRQSYTFLLRNVHLQIFTVLSRAPHSQQESKQPKQRQTEHWTEKQCLTSQGREATRQKYATPPPTYPSPPSPSYSYHPHPRHPPHIPTTYLFPATHPTLNPTNFLLPLTSHSIQFLPTTSHPLVS